MSDICVSRKSLFYWYNLPFLLRPESLCWGALPLAEVIILLNMQIPWERGQWTASPSFALEGEWDSEPGRCTCPLGCSGPLMQKTELFPTQGSLEFVWWWVKWIEIPWGWRIWGRAEASDLTLPWNSGLAFYSGSFLLDGLLTEGFPGGSDGKESACKAGDTGLIPGSGRSLGEGNGRPLQISCLENPMDRGTWLQSMGSQRVGQDRVTNTFTFFPLAEQ